eukprot:TRINITY_DN2618_c0_g1_i1.p1 TRINITY_DN2618_c0_g1~~TRINITY_DN2618_c0_g1_i1.p1  ORF type:complete len:699 (+),score=170.95 TRINITY_DN2618_c0_g1_i1:586-2682(+)
MSARNRSLSRSRTKPGELPPAAVKHVAKRAEGPVLVDPKFSTINAVKSHYQKYVAGSSLSFEWALCRPDGAAFRGKLAVFPEDQAEVMISIYLAGALIQEMLWQRSASSLFISGPPMICEAVKSAYSEGGLYEFEITTMPGINGAQGEPFEVEIVEDSDLPVAKAAAQDKKLNYYEMALKKHPEKAHLHSMSVEEQGGFYALYAELFAAIAKEEEEVRIEDADADYQSLPEFGLAESQWSDVSNFYKHWLEFSTRKSFEDANEWKTNEAESRKLRRGMEEQNKILRLAAKRAFNSEVRELVAYVQKRDPRYQTHLKEKMQEDREKIQRKRAERESRKAAEAQKRIDRREAQRREEDARWEEVQKARQARKDRGEVVSDEDGDSDQEAVEIRCELCRKSFKSKKQFETHVKSKKHLQAVAQAKQSGDAVSDDDSDAGQEEAEGANVQSSKSKKQPEQNSEFNPPARVSKAEEDDASDPSDEDASEEEKGERGRGKKAKDESDDNNDSDKDVEEQPRGRARQRASASKEFYAEVGNLKFKSEKAYNAHMKSKKHRAEEAFKKKMEELMAAEGAADASASAAAPEDEKPASRKVAIAAEVNVVSEDEQSEDEEEGISKRERKAKQKEQLEKEHAAEEDEEIDEENMTHAERKRLKTKAKKEALLAEQGEKAVKAAPKARRALHCRRNAHGGGRVGGGFGGR